MTSLNNDNTEYLSQVFSNINHPSETFSAVEFECCTFKNCDFSDSEFYRCSFIDCDFIECNLSMIKISATKFSDVNFKACKLVGLDWTKAAWPNIALSSPVSYHDCIINDSSFFGLNVQEMIMKNCKAHDVDFREADFSEANLSGTDLAHSLFSNTNLTHANFSNAFNYNIDIHNNNIKGAKFSRDEATGLLLSLGIELVD